MVLSNRYFLFAVWCFLFSSFYGQDLAPEQILPTPSISSANSYGLGEGLVVTCLNNTLTDHKGRLWINPCKEGNVGPTLNFFQYDGKRSTFFHFQPEWITNETDTLVWRVVGETPEGFLYGMDHTHTVAFLWNPDSKEQYFFASGENETIQSMALGPQNRLIVLTFDPQAYHIYHFPKSSAQRLKTIPVDFMDGLDPKLQPPFVVLGDHIWFYHQTQGIINVNLVEGKSQLYLWENLIGRSIDLNFLWNKIDTPHRWRILPFSRDNLLLYLGAKEGFFTMDLKNLILTPLPRLNQFLEDQKRSHWIGVWAGQDLQKNTLITLVYGPQNRRESSVPYQAMLIDNQGHISDYTELMKEVANFSQYETIAFGSGTYFSKDFQRELIWSSAGGLVAIELQPYLDIEAFPLDKGTRAISALDENHLLINTDGDAQKLNLQNTSYDLFFQNFANDIYILSSLRQTPDGQIWASSTRRGLLEINKIQETFQMYPIDLFFDKFIFIEEEKVLILTRKGEFYNYDLKTEELEPFLYEKAPFSIQSISNELHLDDENILWIAAQNGLWKIDLKEGRIDHIDHPLLEKENIICLHIGKEDELWLGTGKKGILIFHKETNQIEQISKVNGLSNNTVAGILADDEGNRWVSTFDGITVISPEREVLFDLSELNGLTHSEFNRTSYAKLPDGRMVFGGVLGVNILNPPQILASNTDTEPLQIVLNRHEFYDGVDEKNTMVFGMRTDEDPIHIPATNRYLFLDFSLSEYVDLDKHTYAYRILPLDERYDSTISIPWNSLGAVSEITLNDLSVGEFVIQVRGVNHRGKQTEKPLEVFIEVEEFFYRTWWFYLLCSLPFLLGIWAWLYRNRTEKQRLREEVERRTAQIREDKDTIERQAEELRELDKVKSRFFTNISHEFRTPLTIISGMITQIHSDPDQWLDKGVELIQRNSNQLLSLINQILDLRKLESNTLKLQFIQGDIIAYVRHIVDSFGPIAQANRIRMHFLPNIEMLEMDFDPDKMMHILSNLLSNAIKYMPDEGGDIYIQIEKTKEKNLEQLSIQIRDNGKGISSEALPYIFDRFYQVENLAFQKPYGSGIGLSLTKELVQLMEGNIEVESTEGKGTTFSLSLPMRKSKEVSEIGINYPATNHHHSPNSQTQQTTTQRLEKKQDLIPEESTGLPSLLIIEDNLDIQTYLRSCLQKHYQLIIANDGQEGIDMAIAHVPELIVSDVMMPNKDGFEVCDTLKNHELTSHIPIILLTAKSSFESKISGLKKGADAYLTKPFEPEELLVRLEQLLLLRNKLQEKYGKLILQEDISSSETNQLDEEFLQKLRAIVMENMEDEEFNIPAFCKAAGLGRTQLHNKIKALTGQSASIFVRNIRLHKAQELLQTTDLNVSEVSYEVGISNPYYFSRIYKELFGVNPRKESRG